MNSQIDTIIESIAEAQDITKEEAAKQYVSSSDYALDFDDLKPQKHSWTDRGAKYTCENAGHPYHEAWKIRKSMTQ